jgi:hypothetical protein
MLSTRENKTPAKALLFIPRMITLQHAEGIAMADPGFEGKEHFLGTLAGAGFVDTPNAAPREWEYFDPISGAHDGGKTDTGFPVGQSQVGFRGVAGGEMPTVNTGGTSGDTDGDEGSSGMPEYT